jgi:hypothetical protein
MVWQKPTFTLNYYFRDSFKAEKIQKPYSQNPSNHVNSPYEVVTTREKNE